MKRSPLRTLGAGRGGGEGGYVKGNYRWETIWTPIMYKVPRKPKKPWTSPTPKSQVLVVQTSKAATKAANKPGT